MSEQAPPQAGSGPALRLPTFPVRWTYVLLAANILVFGFAVLTGQPLLTWGALIPQAVLHGGQWWRLITSAFLHLSLTHIAFNMYALYVLGRDVERLFGGMRFIIIYAVSLLGGALFVALFAPMRSATAGASGAILGVMGAMIAYLVRYSKRMSHARREMWNLVGWAALNILIGFIPGVSLWGHLGGLLFGLAGGWLLTPRYRLETFPSYHLVITPTERWQWLATAGLIAVVPFALVLAMMIR